MNARSAILAVLLLAGAASADTLHVPQDFATIQAAVDVAQPGDVIVIKAGIHTEDADLTGKSQLELRGSGNARVDGKFVLNGSDHITITRLHFVGSFGAAISIFAGGSITISKCHFEPPPLLLSPTQDALPPGGVFTQQTSDLVLDKDVFSGHPGTALTLSGAAPTGPWSVTHCRFEDGAADGIELDNSVDGTIEGCSFRDLAGNGVLAPISLLDGTASASNTTLSHCSFQHMGHAVRFVTGDGFTVDHAKVSHVTQVALDSVAAGTFTNNTIRDAAGGVLVEGDGVHISGNSVRDGSGIGIELLGDAGTVSANKVSASGSTGLLVNGAGNEVTGNTCKHSAGDGLLIQVGPATLSGNVARHSGLNGFELDCSGATLSGNKASGSGDFDLLDDQPGANVIDADNDFKTQSP
jgi:Right handed beta helix region